MAYKKKLRSLSDRGFTLGTTCQDETPRHIKYRDDPTRQVGVQPSENSDRTITTTTCPTLRSRRLRHNTTRTG